MKAVENNKYIDAIFEEYKILSSEIQQRVDRQEQLSHLSILSSAAIISAFGFIVVKPELCLILLMFPLIYCIIIWLILRHDTMLRTLAQYINNNLKFKLNQKLNLKKNSEVWEWEKFRYTNQLKSGFFRSVMNRFLAFTRYIIPYSLSLASLFLYILVKKINHLEFNNIDFIFLFINILILLFTFVLMLFWVLQSSNILKN